MGVKSPGMVQPLRNPGEVLGVDANGNLAAISGGASPGYPYRGAWSGATTYGRGDVVQGSDGFLDISIVATNKGNDPTLDDGSHWQYISNAAIAAWAVGTTYAQADCVIGSDGKVYASLAGGNVGHDPTSDAGVHWYALALLPGLGLPVVQWIGTAVYEYGDVVSRYGHLYTSAAALAVIDQDPLLTTGAVWSRLEFTGNAPPWNATYEYLAGDLATAGGRTYASVFNNGTNSGNDPTADDGTHWRAFPGGWQGAYAAPTIYGFGDIVKSVVDGHIYLSIANANTGNEPSADAGVHWQALNA